MAMVVYEGFVFSNFSNSDYSSANLTTHITFPHLKDFNKHKFQDVMFGDTLLAGTETPDGKILVGGEVGFSKVYGTEITPYSLPASLVTLNSLQSGGLLGINSFSPLIKTLFPHRLVMAKGNVGNFTVVHQDATIYTKGITLTSAANYVKLYVPFKRALPNGIYKYVFDIFLTSSEVVKVYLYGQCGERGFTATTRYEHWSGSARGSTDQTSAVGGYFSLLHGNYLHLTGSFRNTNQKITNYGKAFALNEGGTYNEFVLQKLTANSTILGNNMTWVFVNEKTDGSLNLTTDSYFYIEKVQTI